MKAVILAGGRGSRLDTGNKCMLKFKNKPILERSLINATKMDVDEIILLVGYKADMVVNYFKGEYGTIPISYVFQEEQKGIVHAIKCCKGYIDKEDFVLMLGDELISNPKHFQMRDWYCKYKCFGVIGIVNVKDKNKIRKNYSILVHNHSVHRLVEKPNYCFNYMMGTGNCIFNNKILDYIDVTPINLRRGRNEEELVDLIQCAIDEGQSINWFEIGSDYENVNDEECLKNMLNWEDNV